MIQEEEVMAINLMDKETAERFELVKKIEETVKKIEDLNGSKDFVYEDILIPIIDTFFRGIDENGKTLPRLSFVDTINHAEVKDLKGILKILETQTS